MPASTSSVHGLVRDRVLSLGRDPERDMRRLDRLEVETVCRHLLGSLLDDDPAGARRSGPRA